MGVSRRIFLQQGALAAAYAGLPLKGHGDEMDLRSRTLPSRDTLKYMTRETFETLLGLSFKVDLHRPSSMPAKSVWLKLDSIEDIPDMAVSNTGIRAASKNPKSHFRQTTSFLLSFKGRVGAQLPQETYSFESADLGKFALFIVPEGRRRLSYNAVISRLINGEHEALIGTV